MLIFPLFFPIIDICLGFVKFVTVICSEGHYRNLYIQIGDVSVRVHFLLSTEHNKDVTASVTIKIAGVASQKDLAHHVKKSNWKIMFIYMPNGSNMNLLSHSLEQKSCEVVFACPENICESTEEENNLSGHPKTLQILFKCYQFCTHTKRWRTYISSN